MKFRNKSVLIEAVQFTLRSFDAVEQFVGGDIGKDGDGDTVVATREGALKLSLNDWVIRHEDGKFSACKPDIFAATYEPA